MAVSLAVLLIAGGVCACSPLFKRAVNFLGRLLSIAGFFVGIVVIVVAMDLALGLNVLSSIVSFRPVPDLSSTNPYLKYLLPVMAVLGIMLFSRPVRNVHWASLISLGLGVLAAIVLRVAFAGLGSTVLVIVFIIVTLIFYTLLRFVQGILVFLGSVLGFPFIALAIGLVSIYFGIVILNAT